jgi:hypothetical protein
MEDYFPTTYWQKLGDTSLTFRDELRVMLMMGSVSFPLRLIQLMIKITSLQGMPRWPGLNHFRSLGSTGEFADGTKFEDLSKACNLSSFELYYSRVILGPYICRSWPTYTSTIT